MNIRFQSIKRPELCVRGMVFAYNLDYGRKIGYKQNIKRGEDGMMALGLKKFGKLVPIRKRKARAITSNNTLKAQGGIFNAYRIRIKQAFRRFGGYFTKKESYKDIDSNLIK